MTREILSYPVKYSPISKDAPPHATAGGDSERVLKMRFDEELTTLLEKPQ